MFGINYASIIGLGLPAVALALVAAAVAAFLYVPVVGRSLAAALIAAAAGTFAYDMGFERRAALDQSATLHAQIASLEAASAESQRQADAARDVAANATAAEKIAEDRAAQNQEDVDQYEAELQRRPVSGCGLTDDDVSRLRGIGPARKRVAPKPPARPFDVRPAG